MSQEAIDVLLVEDNPDHAELIQRVLKRQSSVATVTAVTRGIEGLQMLSQNSYSVVLLDYSLPGMDGLTVLKEIRRRGYDLPVVMVTSQGVERVAVEAMQEGASDYLIKAAGYLTTLPTMLSKVLKQHELRMENLRLLEETRTRAQVAETVGEVGRLISQSLQPQEVQQRIVESLRAILGTQNCVLFRQAPESGDMVAVAFSGEKGDPFDPILTLPRGTGMAGLALRERHPVATGDLLADPRVVLTPELRARFEQASFRSALSAPLIVKDGVIGGLSVGDRLGRVFNAQEIQLAQTFADQAALALENARLFEETERRAHEQAALNAIAMTVSQSLRVGEMLRLALDKVLEVTGRERGHIWQLDPKTGNKRCIVHRGVSEETLQAISSQQGRIEEVFTTRTPIVVNDPLTQGLLKESIREGVQALAWVPIIAKGEVIAVMTLSSKRPLPFQPREIELLQAIGNVIGVAVENARLYEETERRRREAEELGGVSRTLTESLDVSAVGQRIAEGVLPLFAAQGAIVWLVRPDSSLVVLASTGPASELLARGYVSPPGMGLAAKAVVEGAVWRSDVLSQNDLVLPDDLRESLAESETAAVLAVPLRTKGKTLGALAIRDRTGRVFTKEEVALLEMFAAQGALALENARLYGEMEQRRREAEELGRVSRNLTESLDLSAVGQRTVEGVLPSFAPQTAVVWLVQPDNSMIVLASTGPARDLVAPGDVFPPGGGFVGRAIAEGRPVWSSDVLKPDGRFAPDAVVRLRLTDSGSTAVLAVPLTVKGKTIGALAIRDRTGRVFTKEEVALLETFAAQGALALENARLYEESRRRTVKLEALARLTRLMTAATEPQEVLDFITQSAVQLLNATNALLWLKDPTQPDELVVRSKFGVAASAKPHSALFQRFKIGQGVIGQIVASRKPEFIPDVTKEPRWMKPEVAETLGRGFFGIPLLLGEDVVGALAVFTAGSRPLAPEEWDLMKILADQGTIALENARLFEEVRRSCEDLRQTQEHLVRVERLRALGEMAGGVAHDFNNLLAVILGRAQYLKMGLSELSPDAVTRSLGIIEQCARDGAETVRHLFEFTRGVPAEPPGSVNINEVVTEAVAASEPRWKDEAESRGITVFVETDLEAIRPALGNASQLREALLNLIFNGVEAMPEGGRLSLATWDDDDGVWLRVTDEGIGMKEEVRRRVFEPFFTTKGPQRSGLGLSMVYGIIAHHGGLITIDSNGGKGTAFLIQLRHAGAPEPAPVAPPVPEIPPSTVLVIDDEEGVRETLADILGATGHKVVVAASGSEGLEWVKRQPFDLICTDLGMPGMSGWQVIAEVKALRPEAPVALITGWGVQVGPEELSAHRADFLLTKPFQISEVLTTLAEARALPNGDRANGG